MNIMDRRELLRDGIRALVCTGMLTAAAALALRPRDEDSCVIDLPCRDCGKRSACSDPKAGRYRSSQQDFSAPKGGQDDS
jgi:hypothetical protein